MNGRRALSLGVIVALAIAIWVAVQSGDDPAPTSTTASTVAPTTQPPATTATTTASTTSTTAPSTTATTAPPTTVDDEARVEEVGSILQNIWFRWLDAIYRADRAALEEIVATERFFEDFDNAVGNLEMTKEPRLEDLVVTVHEILHDEPQCLVVHRTIEAGDLLATDEASEGVDVLWPHDGTWRLAAGWTSPNDLWQPDCEASTTEEE